MNLSIVATKPSLQFIQSFYDKIFLWLWWFWWLPFFSCSFQESNAWKRKKTHSIDCNRPMIECYKSCSASTGLWNNSPFSYSLCVFWHIYFCIFEGFECTIIDSFKMEFRQNKELNKKIWSDFECRIATNLLTNQWVLKCSHFYE